MSKRVISCVKAASVGLVAAATLLGTNHATLAADDCLAGPNRPPAPGGHWYYRFDHAGDRKCWYLVEPATRAPVAEAPEPQPASDPTHGTNPLTRERAAREDGASGTDGVTK